ncbi:MAG: hypothetical protein M3O70_06150, partial [Actinomycetota bacterium]|nr:hypothetical protein [Actinomycetota bacterium]
VRILTYQIHFDSPEQFLVAETSSSPLGVLVDRLDHDVRTALLPGPRLRLGDLHRQPRHHLPLPDATRHNNTLITVTNLTDDNQAAKASRKARRRQQSPARRSPDGGPVAQLLSSTPWETAVCAVVEPV